MVKNNPIERCVEDCWNAYEEGTFAIETPTTYVEQSAIKGLNIGVTSKNYPMVYLRFTLCGDDTKVVKELRKSNPTVVVYGEWGIWYLEDIWRCDITTDVNTDEKLSMDILHEWGRVEFAAWRCPL